MALTNKSEKKSKSMEAVKG